MTSAPEPSATLVPEAAGADALSEDARGLLAFLRDHPVLMRAIGDGPIIEMRIRSAGREAMALLPSAVQVEINPASPREIATALDTLGGSQRCIVVRNVLQCLDDYRGFIAGCLRKLAVGGHLIVIVPHQFLYERKLQVPSRFNRAHRRFYTPNALLAEIEEALDPGEYRVRFLADNDTGYDYDAAFDDMPRGSHDLVLCLERIVRSTWCDQLVAAEEHGLGREMPARILPLDPAAPKSYRVIAPDHAQIQRILILKLDHRGDFLMADHAFRILRGGFADAAITLVCGSWNRADAEASGLFDRVLTFDFFPEDASATAQARSFDELLLELEALLRGAEFDLAIDLRLYDDTRKLLWAVKARHRAGFDPFDAFGWLSVRLMLPIPSQHGRAERGLIPASAFATRIGRKHWVDVAFPRLRRYKTRETLLWGPYTRLPPGNYDLELLFEPIGHAFEIVYELVDRSQVFARGHATVAPDKHPHIRLTIDREIENFECRILTGKRGWLRRFHFMGILWSRQGAYIGVHQIEAMALLAHLVPLRLQAAYTVSTS